MDEYIEREAISEKIRKYYYKNPPNSSYGEGFDRGLDRAQRAILDAPAADVAPVRHGSIIETIEDGRMKRVFSCCGTDFTKMTCWMAPNYCPNCGAKLDLEE